MAAESWANLVAAIAIVAGVGGTVFTQIWQSRQEEKRTTGQRWLEERRVAYAAVLAAADRDISGFGYLLFVAHHEDWENFVLPNEGPEAGEVPDDTQHDLQTATSELELIAPKPIRELAEELESGIREFDWRLTVARITSISPEEVAYLSEGQDGLKEIRSRLADAMRADVNGMKNSPAL
ncbi:hypothetical protein [Oerskovia sp. KBS0722]|uniref:hypothetical protein n=1 Tax=Oerskovia sp. KBS0722 TaxID=1179673 RepID=UPI00110D6F7D|nr:hypothetical protein [Oerskovia sp. KBS0722]QDW63332.1 hypothetical protein FFI11_013165 [Oerskovia sp. KBS0722]